MQPKEYREKHGQSQAEFAKMLKMSKRTVQTWEYTGKCPTYVAELLELLDSAYRDEGPEEDLEQYERETEEILDRVERRWPEV